MQQELKEFKKHLRLTFIVPLILAAVLAGVFALQTYYLRESLQAVEHSYLVQSRSRTLLKLILDMETALRGYLLTGEQRFLQPYESAVPSVGPAFDDLMTLTANDSRQQQLVGVLRKDYDDWQEFASQMIAMRESGGPVDNIELNVWGQRIMDNFRSRRDELLQIEERRLQARIQRVRQNLRRIFATVVALSLSTGLLLATFSRREMQIVAHTFRSALRDARNRTEELHQNQRWLAAIIGSIADGVIATDLNGKIVFTNVVARRILGSSADEKFAGNRIEDVFFIEREYTHDLIPDPYLQVMTSQDTVSFDGHMILHSRKGSEIPVTLKASPIRSDEGKLNGVVIVLRDLTEQRKSEQSLQSAEKLAGIGRIAASVAHEIHNPLDALGNLLYLIDHSQSLTEPNKTYVRLAREELERITSISEQMLTFSREARQPVKVDLVEVLENVLTLYDTRIRRQEVVVIKNFSETGSVVAFPGEMRQIFSNLIGNALDAMNGPGKLTLRIEESHSWDKKTEAGVRVMVCDTGSGVPDEVRGKLMEPFVTSKGEKGTGLGLWVCRGIVEKYRGSLRYHSSTAPGRSGTCFSVFLPYPQMETKLGELTGQRAS